ncbi:MAG TPA: 16S rRNA (guanine(527)-N(7))-methyltransferase RsmG [Elusimicrobia bacterium]|nr:16S rRNA (guanine(527)-N(7))-methyltransferase RsmG [Elusimicrobiota bacterium]
MNLNSDNLSNFGEFMEREIEERLELWGLKLDAQTKESLETLAHEIKKTNAVLNLISKNDEPLLWSRHLSDSLAAAPLLKNLLSPGALMADAGSGPGFPALPLAAALPAFNFELWDSNRKRVEFALRAAGAMKLKNTTAFHRRIGQSGAFELARYDAVVERAMGKLENILFQCLNMLKSGGVFLAWQSGLVDAQTPASLKALDKAGAKLETRFAYTLPGETRERFILIFRRK